MQTRKSRFSQISLQKASPPHIVKAFVFLYVRLEAGRKETLQKSIQRAVQCTTNVNQIPRKKLGGICSVSDLWSNVTSIRYLKENQMFCNKEVILKQFKEFGKDI